MPAKIALAVALVLHIAAMAVISMRGGQIPEHRSFRELPSPLGTWTAIQEEEISEEIQSVLRADDYLARHYRHVSGYPVALFVAWYASQRTGANPHSPRNCLPGTGWVLAESSTISIPITGGKPIEAQVYVMTRGTRKSVVVYWYQSRDRTTANEYRARVELIADSIRWNRTDTALVRVVAPVIDGQVDIARVAAVSFTQALYVPLRGLLPR